MIRILVFSTSLLLAHAIKDGDQQTILEDALRKVLEETQQRGEATTKESRATVLQGLTRMSIEEISSMLKKSNENVAVIAQTNALTHTAISGAQQAVKTNTDAISQIEKLDNDLNSLKEQMQQGVNARKGVRESLEQIGKEFQDWKLSITHSNEARAAKASIEASRPYAKKYKELSSQSLADSTNAQLLSEDAFATQQTASHAIEQAHKFTEVSKEEKVPYFRWQYYTKAQDALRPVESLVAKANSENAQAQQLQAEAVKLYNKAKPYRVAEDYMAQKAASKFGFRKPPTPATPIPSLDEENA